MLNVRISFFYSKISTVVSSSAGLLAADIHGSIHILNKEFVSTTSWVAHVGGRVIHMAERMGVLVTIGGRRRRMRYGAIC